MKPKLFLYLALILLAELPTFAFSVISRLQPTNINSTSFSIKVRNAELGKQFTVFLKTNGHTRDKFLHARLDLRDEDHQIASTQVEKRWMKNGIQFKFTVSPAYLSESKFTITEFAHDGKTPMPAFDEDWFYLIDFAGDNSATGAGNKKTNAISSRPIEVEQHFKQFLAGCGTNEIRCLWFLHDDPKTGMRMTINLADYTVHTMREVFNRAEQSSHTRKLSDSQVGTLEEIVDNMPPSDKNVEFGRSIFVSRQKENKMEVFHYDRHRAPSSIQYIYDVGEGYFYSGKDD